MGFPKVTRQSIIATRKESATMAIKWKSTDTNSFLVVCGSGG